MGRRRCGNGLCEGWYQGRVVCFESRRAIFGSCQRRIDVVQGCAGKDAVAADVILDGHHGLEAQTALGRREPAGEGRIVLAEHHEAGEGVGAQVSNSIGLALPRVGNENEEELREGGVCGDCVEDFVAQPGEASQEADERGGDAGDEGALGLGDGGECRVLGLESVYNLLISRSAPGLHGRRRQLTSGER